MRRAGFIVETTLITIGAIAFALLVIGALAGVAQKQHELQAIRSSAAKSAQDNNEGAVIKNFMAQWSVLQKSIPMQPVLGSTSWFVDDFQFIGSRALLVAFEDGHVAAAAVFRYQTDGTFSYLTVFKDNFPFRQEQWRGVVQQYGDAQYPAATYTKEVVRGGTVVNYEDWTKVPENKFVRTQAAVVDTSTWKTYRNEQYGFEVKFPCIKYCDTEYLKRLSDVNLDNMLNGIAALTTPTTEEGDYLNILVTSPDKERAVDQYLKQTVEKGESVGDARAPHSPFAQWQDNINKSPGETCGNSCSVVTLNNTKAIRLAPLSNWECTTLTYVIPLGGSKWLQLAYCLYNVNEEPASNSMSIDIRHRLEAAEAMIYTLKFISK